MRHLAVGCSLCKESLLHVVLLPQTEMILLLLLALGCVRVLHAGVCYFPIGFHVYLNAVDANCCVGLVRFCCCCCLVLLLFNVGDFSK